MAYTPPSSPNFNFLSTYTPATTPLTLTFDTGSEIFPSSIDESTFGSPAVLNTRQYLSVDGFDSTSFGTAHVKLEARSIDVGGIATPPNTGPQAYRQLPTPTVEFRTKAVYPSGLAPIALPAPAFTHYIQYITINPQPPFGFYGTPNISIRQFVDAPTIYSIRFGYPVLTRWLDIFAGTIPLGSVGTPAVRDRREVLYVPPISPLADAFPTLAIVENRTREIHTIGIVGVERMFSPVVENRTRMLYVSAQMGSDGDPTGWAPFPATVRNRNVELPMFGTDFSRFSVSGTEIRNVHLVVAPTGITGVFGEDTTATHGIRSVYPPSFATVEYTIAPTMVSNAARVISSAGAIPPSLLGYEVDVINRNRKLLIGPAPNGSIPSAVEFGTPFIAFAIRYVYPSVLLWGAEPIHDIRINPKPISPISIPDPDDNATFALVGHPRIEERFNIIRPKSVNVSTDPLFGVLSIVNRNRAVLIRPAGEQAVYGTPTVANIIRNIPIGGISSISFGRQAVEHLRRTISVFNPPRPDVAFVPASLTVRNTDDDPPTVRYVLCYSINQIDLVPHPIVRDNTVTAEGFTETLFGIAVLSGNVISPARGIFDADQVGIPTLNGDQFIFPKGAPWPLLTKDNLTGSSDQNTATPSISPHTIYAPSSDQATLQAVLNNGEKGEVMDYIYTLGNPEQNFGVARIDNRIRTISNVGVYWFFDPYFPTDPKVELRKRYILATGIKSPRFGHTDVGGGLQLITMDEFSEGYFGESFGDHLVGGITSTVPFAKPLGIPPADIGEAGVTLKHRSLPLVGIPHRGNPQQELTNPWGVADVHYPYVHIYGVGHAVGWGTPRVEHRVRSLYTAGHDSSYVYGYSLFNFVDRMRVTRRNPKVSISSIVGTSFGESVVTFSVRDVYARGVAPAITGSPTVSSRATISAVGWDSLVVGDIDRWESGKVKPYGSELSLFDQPRVCWGISPSGISDGTVGAHGTGYLITVYGLPPIGFEGPSVTDLFGCNNRVTVPLPVLPLLIPTPTVGHI